MSDPKQFDYYYGAEADQFSFIRIPKLIIVDPKFAELSLGAKMLYGMLLDRMNLSMKHGWMDEENRVYIRFKIGDIGEALAISEPTATKYLKELEKIGLVEKKRIGLGIGNILYVKNFISPDLKDKALITIKNLRNEYKDKQTAFANITGISTSESEHGSVEASKINIHKNSLGIVNKEIMGIESKESVGNEDKNCLGNETQDFSGQSNNEINNIKLSNNKYNNILSDQISEDDKIYLCYKHRARRVLDTEMDEIDKMPKHMVVKTAICDQVNEDALIERYPDSVEIIKNIIDVMVEIMLSTRPTIMISGNEYDSAYVKSRIFCIFEQHMEYMLDCIAKNTTKVGNVKAYLRATIFNCTTTMGCYDDLTVQNLFAETYNA